MAGLKGKKIVLGITGSIAAYKAAFLTRLLTKAGADVQILMTPAATSFISSLTLSTLSKRQVFTELSSEESWNNHVELGLWADAMVIAPATANTLARMAHGICDNIIVATYLSARCPVFFAPAMDVDMWHHPATRKNVELLRSFGNELIPVEHGELASGLVGEGRMAEPEQIVAHLRRALDDNKKFLEGLEMLITAGPTYEPLDPVRFIGNRSSGKMGIALADEACRRGARVRLVLGPSRLQPAEEQVEVIRVETAEEMYEQCVDRFPDCQVAIMAAAVSDYRPRELASRKIKKKEEAMQLRLVRNPDIARKLGEMKKQDQLLVGFALETHDEEKNAREKIGKKNFDFIVLNSLREEGAGFDRDTNKVSIIHPGNKIRNFELKSKAAVAEDILDEVVALIEEKSSKNNK